MTTSIVADDAPLSERIISYGLLDRYARIGHANNHLPICLLTISILLLGQTWVHCARVLRCEGVSLRHDAPG